MEVLILYLFFMWGQNFLQCNFVHLVFDLQKYFFDIKIAIIEEKEENIYNRWSQMWKVGVYWCGFCF